MRAYILTAIGLTCLCAAPAGALPLASGADILKADHRVYQDDSGRGYRSYDRDDYGRRGRGRWGSGVDCRELRRACLYKEDLGEVGRGNCQRYRSLCR